MMYNFTWSDSNQKLNKTAKHWQKRFGSKAVFLSFNIPQLQSKTGKVTCPYAGDCARVCYADQGRLAMALAKAPRERNLSAILRYKTRGKIAEALVQDLRRHLSRKNKVTHLRLHDSGDFFNRTYYRAWIDVAHAIPEITFYAYTKSIPFLQWDDHPKNLRVVQSLGGKKDHEVDLERPHSRIFVSDEERKMLGYCDGNVDDMPAILGHTKIGLVYHGNRKLDDESRRRLTVVQG